MRPEVVDVKKIRRTVSDADAGDGSFWVAASPRGEILQCAQLVPLLQQISRNLVRDPDTPWEIGRDLLRLDRPLGVMTRMENR